MQAGREALSGMGPPASRNHRTEAPAPSCVEVLERVGDGAVAGVSDRVGAADDGLADVANACTPAGKRLMSMMLLLPMSNP